MREERIFDILGQVNDEFIEEASPLVKTGKRYSWVKWCAMAASLCLIISGVLFGQNIYKIYAMEVSYISIDVNPSIELCLNQFDRVIDVIAYNADGQKVVDCLNVKNKNYTDAIEMILSNEVFSSYLSEEADLTFTIVSDKESEIRKGIEQCTKNQGMIYSTDNGTRQAAYENHCSVGKYAAYEELAQYDESVTIEDCRDMTLHEIHERIKECESHHGNRDSQNSENSNPTIYDDYTGSEQQGHHSEKHH